MREAIRREVGVSICRVLGRMMACGSAKCGIARVGRERVYLEWVVGGEGINPGFADEVMN